MHITVIEGAFRRMQVQVRRQMSDRKEDSSRTRFSRLKGRATQISAEAHLAMVAAVAPCVDSSLSKTVNVSARYPFEDFEGLYRYRREQGLRSVATFRLTTSRDSELSPTGDPQAPPADTAERAGPAQGTSPEPRGGYCPTCRRLTPGEDRRLRSLRKLRLRTGPRLTRRRPSAGRKEKR